MQAKGPRVSQSLRLPGAGGETSNHTGQDGVSSLLLGRTPCLAGHAGCTAWGKVVTTGTLVLVTSVFHSSGHSRHHLLPPGWLAL